MKPDEAEALGRFADPAAIERLGAYAELLASWSARINLVAPATLAFVWSRHFLDSAQLAPLLPAEAGVVADLGSGAGFPGLVLAVVSGREVRLVESDSRKCAFLREAARVTGARVEIVNARIEASRRLPVAAVVTARALAPLPKLLSLAHPLLASGGRCLLLKGANADRELTDARRAWTMRATTRPSVTDPAGVILDLTDIAPRHDA